MQNSILFDDLINYYSRQYIRQDDLNVQDTTINRKQKWTID